MFAKLRLFFSKKRTAEKPVCQPEEVLEVQPEVQPEPANETTVVVEQVDTCVAPQPSSLVVLATSARGEDAETLFPQQFMQEVSVHCTLQIEKPISMGALATWMKALMTDGVRVSEINRILGIDIANLALTQPVNVSVSLCITDAETPRLLEAPEQTEGCTSVTLCDDIIATSETPKQLTPAIITEESTSLIITTPCPRPTVFHATPILSRLTALQSSLDIESLPIEQPSFTPQPEPLTERLSTKDFDIVGVLGKGGFGTAYAARFNWSGGYVALKAIRKRVKAAKKVKRKPVPRADTFGEDLFAPAVKDQCAVKKMGSATAKNCESTISEWLAMRRLDGVEGVVEVLASWHDSNNFYIAMPLYNGGDLHTRLISQGGRFPIDVARFYTAELLNGLTSLHSHGVIHRDLKLANVLIGPDGHVKIADFGLARCFEHYASDLERSILPNLCTMDDVVMDRFSEVTNTGCGTPEFAAPEVFREDLYSYKVDIWSLGVMVFKMIVGRSPWAESDGDALAYLVTEGMYEIRASEQKEYGIDEDTVLFIQRALDKDSSTRPSAIQLKGHLFFKSFDWVGLANNTLQSPWIPNASEVFVSRSCPKEAEIDAGLSLNLTEDPIPYFNYLSPRMADAPTTLPKLVSSRTNLPPPQLIGYALNSAPTSASGIQQYVNREIIHLQSNSTPFSQFWAMNVTMNRRISELRRSSLSWLNRLDRGHVDSSPVFDLQRPGALNLATNPLDASPAVPPSISFVNCQPIRNEYLDVPTSVSPESLNIMDFVLREESVSLPFVLFRHEPESSLSSKSLPSLPRIPAQPYGDFEDYKDPTSTSELPIDVQRLVLREESASLPFFVPRPPVALMSEGSGEESRRDCSDYSPPSPTSSSRFLFDLVALVEREDSSSLPFLLNKASPPDLSSTSVTFYDMEQQRESSAIDKPTPPSSPEILQANLILPHLRESSPDRTLCYPEDASSADHKLSYVPSATPGQQSHEAVPAVSATPILPTSTTPPRAVMDNAIQTSKPSSSTLTHIITRAPLSTDHTAPVNAEASGCPLTTSDISPQVSLSPKESHNIHSVTPFSSLLQCLQNHARSLWSLVTSFLRIAS